MPHKDIEAIAIEEHVIYLIKHSCRAYFIGFAVGNYHQEGNSDGHPRRRGQTFELAVAFPLPSAAASSRDINQSKGRSIKSSLNKIRLWVNCRMTSSQSLSKRTVSSGRSWKSAASRASKWEIIGEGKMLRQQII